MPDLRQQRVEVILARLQDLPTLPVVAVKILQMTGDDNGGGGSARDVARLIESDPSLSARVLRMVRRADLGVREEVSSVERAVALLGFEAVRTAVLAVCVFQNFPDSRRDKSPLPTGLAMDPSTDGANTVFDRTAFWTHCIAVACCAELLAKELPRSAQPALKRVDPALAFACGLLHDIGKIALDAMLPKSFARVVEAADLLRGDIADLERKIIGVDHLICGKRLAERWQLPAAIVQCTWLHGQAPTALPASVANARLINIITLADLIVREAHLGYSGNFSFALSRQTLLDAVGVSAAQVDGIGRLLPAAVEARASTLGLGDVSSDELYYQALSQANRELGRVSQQLTVKNRKLTTRAKFFDALGAFHAELRADAPLPDMLRAIARSAAESGLSGVQSCVAFSLAPGHDYAPVFTLDRSLARAEGNAPDGEAEEDVSESFTLVQRAPLEAAAAEAGAPTFSMPVSGSGPVLLASDELDWLLAETGATLAGEHRYWLCLQADQSCIGGIVWGAPAGEVERLAPQSEELSGLCSGWSLALRTAQLREESRVVAEQLADANRRLQGAQDELSRSRAISTVAEMAAGAAHEMNNPLAVISGRSQLLAATLTDPKQQASAKLIVEQSERLSAMITELMDFARPQPPKLQSAELSEVLAKGIAQAKRRANQTDRTVEQVVPVMPAVMVDGAQVASAIAELLDNAFAATASATAASAAAATAKRRVIVTATVDPNERQVVLTIADDGCGMDEQTLKRAFDPFFSSKTAGRRRGMGLSRALRWITASGGSIRLESELRRGTRATVMLRTAEPAATSVATPAEIGAVPAADSTHVEDALGGSAQQQQERKRLGA